MAAEPEEPRAEPQKLGMYGWYDPSHLLQTGIRVAIATIFGEFLDRRELFGDRNSTAPLVFDTACDYSKAGGASRDELWLDFVADSGDGWRSTLAVARLLARARLDFEKTGEEWSGAGERGAHATDYVETTRGEVLIFGGDEVYATASREEYRTRLQGPFDRAAKIEGVVDDLRKADVYALPGNHDWYDGLNAFMGLFVVRRPTAGREGFGSGREVGFRRTKQTRSYFALKLPGNWWLIGVDAQLSGYIDQGQISFFDDLAQTVMDDRSNIIMCAATPSWSYVHLDGGPEEKFRNHAFFEQVITGNAHDGDPGPVKNRRHNLRLVLTGDSHHYSRYMEGSDGPKQPHAATTDIPAGSRCYLTWGGGGAFMHPTQQLRDVSFRWYWPPPPPVTPIGTKKAPRTRKFALKLTYPDSAASWMMSLRVPLFAINNLWFSALMGGFGLIVAWALAGTASLAGPDKRLPDSIRGAESSWEAFKELVALLITFPWVALTCLALIAALVYFSAAQNQWIRRFVGVAHFAAYLVVFFALFVAICRSSYLDGLSPFWASFALVTATAVGAAVLAPTIMGIYLFLSLFFRRHWNEAFSSLRIEDHKGFLRLHIKDGAVTVYPIVMDAIPKSERGALKTRLIERPIRLAP